MYKSAHNGNCFSMSKISLIPSVMSYSVSEVSFFSNVAHMHLRLQFIKNRNANNEDAKKLNVSVNVDVSFSCYSLQCNVYP